MINTRARSWRTPSSSLLLLLLLLLLRSRRRVRRFRDGRRSTLARGIPGNRTLPGAVGSRRVRYLVLLLLLLFVTATATVEPITIRLARASGKRVTADGFSFYSVPETPFSWRPFPDRIVRTRACPLKPLRRAIRNIQKNTHSHPRNTQQEKPCSYQKETQRTQTIRITHSYVCRILLGALHRSLTMETYWNRPEHRYPYDNGTTVKHSVQSTHFNSIQSVVLQKLLLQPRPSTGKYILTDNHQTWTKTVPNNMDRLT